MKLFYISAKNSDGEDMSAFVIAGYKAEAIAIWSGLTFVTPNCDDLKVFAVLPSAVSVSGEARALNWHHEVREV